MINTRIKKLREKMAEQKIDAYLVPSEDFHQSEYVGDYFKSRVYISGFTGSAGFVLITTEKAFLWTDGRYFLQAEKELTGSEVILQKMGEAGVPTLTEYLKENLKENCVLAFDGRCVSLIDGKIYEDITKNKNGSIIYNLDLIGEIWDDRPSMSKEKAFLLDVKYAGESAKSKLARLREKMQTENVNTHIICSLDDICWLFNIRGGDVLHSPLILSYAIITLDNAQLFLDKEKLNNEILTYLTDIGVETQNYNNIYDYVKQFDKKSNIMLDSDKFNYALFKNIPEECDIIYSINPTTVFKAAKNEAELNNMREAQVKDGVAWVKFMKWLEENVGKIEITEIQASEKLDSFRKEWDSYIMPSFSAISGYGANGAIVHYKASEETQSKLQAKSLYLSDTGANYYEGTTDITRTVALGELTEEEKYHYTLVLKSHIAMATTVFMKGTVGSSLDIRARKPFWDEGLDFKHGTGHGVGYLLNVHEGPCRLHYTPNPNPNLNYPLMLGLVITNEPGIYIAGKHGIRIENEMIVREYKKSELGEFYCFENATYVPIDVRPINFDMLNQEEIDFLNDYHQMVFEKLSPYLTGNELDKLKEYTRKVGK